jgi:hypothetical protein
MPSPGVTINDVAVSERSQTFGGKLTTSIAPDRKDSVFVGDPAVGMDGAGTVTAAPKGLAGDQPKVTVAPVTLTMR